jgi:hypothetical protein|uniref:Hydrogenase/urease nickel incorporation protein n=1 Tax=Caudovirales sp. ct1Jx6 TaxID=2826765 RepID=A0A8S5MLH4_9CAUD|nr:MAG TPA: hydrogenase/urease nickel incorporation protein [Caudovirales sp. ct1Jx6]
MSRRKKNDKLRENKSNERYQVESLKAAIFALKKQIPQKPTPSEKQHIRYAMCFTCPSCGRDFSGTGIADYCYHCGQALDWGDAE